MTAVAQYCGIAWLMATDRYHPIRRLWSSFDFISTQELYWLGDSILLMAAIDETWLRGTLKKAMAFDGSRAGYVFEVVALAALARGGLSIMPTEQGSQDFDAFLEVADDKQLAISLKSFGATSRETSVEGEALSTLRELELQTKKLKRHWFGFACSRSTFPRAVDWVNLRSELTSLLRSSNGVNKWLHGSGWDVMQMPVPKQYLPLSPNFQSYNLLIAVPHHPNETKTFEDKLLDEARKFDRAAANSSLKYSVLIVRLSENADLEHLRQAAESFLTHSATALSGIIIIQTAVSIQTAADTTSIVVSVAQTWNSQVQMHPLRLSFATGIMSDSGSHYNLVGDEFEAPLPPSHIFARRCLFPQTRIDMTKLDGSSASGAYRPGDTINMVMSFGEGPDIAFMPKYAIPTRLSLFS